MLKGKVSVLTNKNRLNDNDDNKNHFTRLVIMSQPAAGKLKNIRQAPNKLPYKRVWY